MTSLVPTLAAADRPAAAPRWREAFPIALGMCVLFARLYSTCNAVAAHRTHVGTWSFAWERHIHLIPWMIVPYMSIDALFFLSFFLCTTRFELWTHAKRIAAANVIATICFLLCPLTMDIPRVVPEGLYAPLYRFMYRMDLPYNLAPSLHIAQGILLWVIFARHTRGWVRHAITFWFALICVSTVLTWQHRTPDVLTGWILGMLCLYLFPDETTEPAPGERTARNTAVAWRWTAAAALMYVLAYKVPAFGWPLAWAASSSAVIAAGYWWFGPAVFRKSGGKLPAAAWWVLFQCLVAGRLAWLYLRRPSRPWVRVLPNLLMGRRLSNREALRLLDEGADAVLDLTAECSECDVLLQLPYANLRMLDLTVPTAAQFDEAVRFIRDHGRYGTVYVHCALGYSRAAAVVAAYLLAEGFADSVDAALAIVRSARPQVVLKEDSIQALRQFERRRRRVLMPLPA